MRPAPRGDCAAEPRGGPARRVGGALGLALLSLWLGGAGPAPNLHQPPGRLFETTDARLHLFCLGSGSPTVVLEAGLGGNHLDWTLVQPHLARATRVCSYDRAGAGFSEKASRPRTLDNISHDLESLLASAGVDGPLVLVGHSFGGVLAASFAARHRDRVAGLVLLDSMHPREFERFAEAGVALSRDPLQVLSRTPAAAAGYGLPQSLQRLAIDLASADKARLSVVREMRGFGESLATAEQRGFVLIPARVLVHGDREWDSAYPDGRMERVWFGLQADLARRLGAPPPEVVPDAGHQIALDAPDAVVRAVEAVIREARP